MLIVIENMMRVYNAKTETLNALQDELEFKNPDYGLALARIDRGKYVAALPPKYLKFYTYDNDHLAIPIGFSRARIKEIARQNNELISVKDRRSNGYKIDFKLPKRGRFRAFEDYQNRIIDNACKKHNAVTVSPTGSGNTLSSLGIIEKLGVSTLIIVDKKDLFNQWVDGVRELTTGTYKLGFWGCGKKKWGDVTIATTQTLSRLNQKQAFEVRDKFGLIIVDEVHKASAPTFVKCVSMFSAKFKHGMSATPKRKDGKEFIFKLFIGNIDTEIKDREVEDVGRIVPVKYEILKTGFEMNFIDIDHDIELYGPIALSDYDRTNFVVEAVQRDLDLGFVPLVVSNRVAHLKNVHKRLLKVGLKSGLVIGEVSDIKRAKVREDMKNGFLDVIVANESIFSTGIDIPVLSSAHVTHITKNEVFLKQVAGRVRRAFKGKEFGKVVIYNDYVYVQKRNPAKFEFTPVEADYFKDRIVKIKRLFRKWNFDEVGTTLQ